MTSKPASQRRSVARQPAELRDAMLIGIGNDGRSDDGLGWAFLNAIEHLNAVQQNGACHGLIVYRYQLQIEDAELISHSNHVVFVDACHHELPNGFQWQTCEPAHEVEYTSHQLSPQTVLFLCQQLYGTTPKADLLLIEGRSWELEIGLSKTAKSNLDRALIHFCGGT